MASSSKHPRKSLAELFENSGLSPSIASSSRSASPQKRLKLKQSLQETIHKGWPSAWMTIRSDDVYREVANISNPKDLFGKSKGWLTSMQSTPITLDRAQELTFETHKAMTRAIFGSNMIERAGFGLDLTIHLCEKVFSGEHIGDISERDIKYQDALLEFYHKKQPGLKNVSARYILRSRNEVVQHARAFLHIIHAFVVEKQDLSEQLIKDTHKILVKGVPITDDVKGEITSEEYGGIYRTVFIHAGTTNFTVPRFVPSQMAEMCASLRQELAKAEEEKTIDPFSVASKYSLRFVQIHPFQDGNGRMCRMILNAILCRYAGVIVPIGEQGEDREVYMGIKRRSSLEMEGHGEYATFVLQKATARIRNLKQKLAGKKAKAPAQE